MKLVFHPFKTRDGAEKRARFENAHPGMRPNSRALWRYGVCQVANGLWRVTRSRLVAGPDNQERSHSYTRIDAGTGREKLLSDTDWPDNGR